MCEFYLKPRKALTKLAESGERPAQAACGQEQAGHEWVQSATEERIMKRSFRLVTLIAFVLLPNLLLASCGRPQVDPAAGELYSVETGDDTFSIVKILVVDDDIVHIRIYNNRFATRPEQVDASQLSLGTLDDQGGFGIGHFPIPLSEFEAWDPRFLQSEGVTEEELEGYELWQEMTGGSSGE